MKIISLLIAAMLAFILADKPDDMAPIYDYNKLDTLWSSFKVKFNKTYNACDDIYRFFKHTKNI